ncbi:MAG: DUF5673 domain-containing protein [Bulleidia sp.]
MNLSDQNLNMILNIAISVIFLVLSVIMFFRWNKHKGKVLIQDQQWSTVRIIFLAVGVLSFVSFLTTGSNSTLWDYLRICLTIVAVTVYMMIRDGVGEEGLLSGGKFYPWNVVRSWDYEERKNVIAVYFTVESQNEKKPDEYVTKELDFSKEDKDSLLKFLELNLSRKYTRMKKKKPNKK